MNSNSPYFSLCIPVFNGRSFIDKAIESVIGQTFDSWALTVIDNQSTDGTWEFLQRVYSKHPKIRLLRNASNLGMRGNLNRCLDEANGQWLGILPADDAYAPHALETINKATACDPNVILWMHAHLVRGEGILTNACVVCSTERRYSASKLAELFYLKGNIFGELSSYFIRCASFRNSNLRFLDGTQSVDTRFWIRVLKANPQADAVYWPDMLTHVLQHTESGSSTNHRTGVIYSDLFDAAGSLSSLGWARKIQLLQLLRLVKCWYLFGRKLPPKSGSAPLRALKEVSAGLFFTGPRPIQHASIN